jgi:hypothetical protein
METCDKDQGCMNQVEVEADRRIARRRECIRQRGDKSWQSN